MIVMAGSNREAVTIGTSDMIDMKGQRGAAIITKDKIMEEGIETNTNQAAVVMEIVIEDHQVTFYLMIQATTMSPEDPPIQTTAKTETPESEVASTTRVDFPNLSKGREARADHPQSKKSHEKQDRNQAPALPAHHHGHDRPVQRESDPEAQGGITQGSRQHPGLHGGMTLSTERVGRVGFGESRPHE